MSPEDVAETLRRDRKEWDALVARPEGALHDRESPAWGASQTDGAGAVAGSATGGPSWRDYCYGTHGT